MDLTQAVGSTAALLTTLAFVPQVVKTLKTRHTRDISLGMWAMFSAGVALWLAYGLLLMAWPIILANAATLVLALIVLAVKLANMGKE
ncbi:MAG: SemiSWEET family sugar transporter [Bacteroidota bacterium]